MIFQAYPEGLDQPESSITPDALPTYAQAVRVLVRSKLTD